MLAKCLDCKKERNIRLSEFQTGHRQYCWECFVKRRVGKNHPMYGKKMSSENIKNLAAFNTGRIGYWKGKHFTKEHIRKVQLSKKDKYLSENSGVWKGDNASYVAKHQWMARHYGKPRKCDFCLTEDSKRFHWANISGKYMRIRTDWLRLCQSCHFKFDKVGEKSWNTRRGGTSYNN